MITIRKMDVQCPDNRKDRDVQREVLQKIQATHGLEDVRSEVYLQKKCVHGPHLE